MSINLWWTPQHQHPQSTLDSSNSALNPKSLIYPHNFHNLNHRKNDDVEDEQVNNIDRHQQPLETMFEKPLTPSDVGKLNRLVIPKQHAERHFPLNTANGADSGGMLLSFEDEAGKFWRFRYSYWNSSQSYVLTKGWSRYVKEKQLESGDFVVFERHPSDPDRLFIGWRRRHDKNAADGNVSGGVYHAHHQTAYPAHQSAAVGVNNKSRGGTCNGSVSSRTLRLFGVDMECQFESDQSEPVTPDGFSTSSPNGQQQEVGYQHYNQQFYPQAYYGMSNLMVQQDGSYSQHRG